MNGSCARHSLYHQKSQQTIVLISGPSFFLTWTLFMALLTILSIFPGTQFFWQLQVFQLTRHSRIAFGAASREILSSSQAALAAYRSASWLVDSARPSSGLQPATYQDGQKQANTHGASTWSWLNSEDGSEMKSERVCVALEQPLRPVGLNWKLGIILAIVIQSQFEYRCHIYQE